MITLTLPWPPTVNHFHQPVRMGKAIRLVKGAKAKQYAKDAPTAISFQYHDEPISTPVRLDITLYPPTRRAIDVDNRLKAVLDALVQGYVIEDDSQVTELTVRRAEVRKGGEAVVIINAHDALRG